jgi:hypothetical protein
LIEFVSKSEISEGGWKRADWVVEIVIKKEVGERGEGIHRLVEKESKC